MATMKEVMIGSTLAMAYNKQNGSLKKRKQSGESRMQ